jgi:hypothetical protein
MTTAEVVNAYESERVVRFSNPVSGTSVAMFILYDTPSKEPSSWDMIVGGISEMSVNWNVVRSIEGEMVGKRSERMRRKRKATYARIGIPDKTPCTFFI